MPLQSAEPPELVVLSQWKGQNNQAARTAIDDQELAWCENLLPIGPGNLRSLWGKGATLASASSTTVVSMSGWASAASGAHILAFFANGGGVDIKLSDGTTTTWASGKFWSGAAYALPIPVVQWGSAGVAILAPLGMFAWDGSALTAPGSAAPTWLTDGATTNLYQPISPAIWQVFAGESYEGRLWYEETGTNGSLYGWSSPGNGADLSGSVGSGTAIPTDPFLVASLKSIVQGSGFLYVIGDNSINAINGVNTGGTPPVTTFTYANVDPQVGALITQQPVRFGRAMAIFNSGGVYALYGGAAELSSEKIQSLIESVTTSSLTPTMALALIHGVKCVLSLVKTTDIFGVTRNMILGWTGQSWFIASQEVNLTLICTSQIGSNATVYGTDGTNIFQLFAAPSPTLTKRITTKLYGGKVPIVEKNISRLYLQAQDITGTGLSFSGTFSTERGSQNITVSPPPSYLNWTNASGAAIAWTNSSGATLAWTLPALSFVGIPLASWGMNFAADLQSTSEDFSLQQMVFGYHDRTLYGA